MRAYLFVVAALALVVCGVSAFGEVHAAACFGQPNLNPIDPSLRLVNVVQNGRLFQAGTAEDSLSVVHVYGTPFEWGVAQGQLLKKEIIYILPTFLKHIETEAEALLPQLPEPIRALIAEYGVIGALDLTYEATFYYTPPAFFDEMRGLANATGLNYWDIVRAHMVPELFQAACSMFGAWGRSTPKGNLYQLRALDWDVSGPLQTYPTVTVYHPNSDNGHAWANVGWAGWIGTLTGMSSSPLAISEKVGDHFGETSRFGIPWHFMLRDILQYDNTLDDAINRMVNAHRTCNVYFGVGDGYQKQFRLFEYTYESLRVYDPLNTPVTPRLPDIVYRGVKQDCFAEQLGLLSAKGNVTALNTVRYIAPVTQTGNLHIAVYDFDQMLMYVANAKSPSESGLPFAYQRAFVELNMRNLFAQK
eukprot:TRINITY_DN435_c0_g1_i1.p1 TRINITY_DN435_c0_g1~~TRINITY_DN435_c0_g1_i1.p1  ORF type:complete len:417 (+),score=67.74 TRINITY_DN435_c0_g1_i1:42-1292(+)